MNSKKRLSRDHFLMIRYLISYSFDLIVPGLLRQGTDGMAKLESYGHPTLDRLLRELKDNGYLIKMLVVGKGSKSKHISEHGEHLMLTKTKELLISNPRLVYFVHYKACIFALFTTAKKNNLE